MEFLREIFGFARARGKFWMLPLLLLVGVFGALVLLTKGSAIAPFIYTLF